MYVDCKISTWERIQIPDNEISDILDGLALGKLTSGDDVYNALEVGNVEFIDGVPSEQVERVDNNDESTIEVYNDKGELIWENKLIPKETIS